MSGMNPGFAAYLAAKKANKASTPTQPTAMPMQPTAGVPAVHRPGLPNIGKSHAKVASGVPNLKSLMAREEKMDAKGGKKSPQEAMMEARINKMGGNDKDAR